MRSHFSATCCGQTYAGKPDNVSGQGAIRAFQQHQTEAHRVGPGRQRVVLTKPEREYLGHWYSYRHALDHAGGPSEVRTGQVWCMSARAAHVWLAVPAGPVNELVEVSAAVLLPVETGLPEPLMVAA